LKIYYNYTEFEVRVPVVTIGVFDGVHKGHVEIINTLIKKAAEINGEPVVLTFWPHPRIVLKQDSEIKLINTLKEKEELLAQNGVKHLIVLPFTEAFSQLSSIEFVKNILVDELNVRSLIIGFNHHFGHGREGNYDSIKQYADRFGFSISRLNAQLVENEKVSSTLIRKSLASGDINSANKYLGYAYPLTGKIVKGSMIGREIGFPTANLKVEEDYKIIPCLGVYAATAIVDNCEYMAMVNIGFRPTINIHPHNVSIEAHLIGFSGDLYNKYVTLQFRNRIRDERKFGGIEDLKKQLEFDKLETINILNRLK
jgi:riboflavin kinase/FMN adenylyltransferase